MGTLDRAEGADQRASAMAVAMADRAAREIQTPRTDPVRRRSPDQSRLPSNGCASTGDSNAMNNVHGSALTHDALCGNLAGPYA